MEFVFNDAFIKVGSLVQVEKGVFLIIVVLPQ